MATDLENIRIIEEKIGIKLYRNQGESFFKPDARQTYLLDKHGYIIGLNLWNCNLADLSFLELLPNLSYLDLSYNDISDISILRSLPNLIRLNLSATKIEASDRNNSTLKSLFMLTWLNLSLNNLSNASILKSLPNLTYLDLSNTHFSNTSILKDLSTLTELNLSYNNLHSNSILILKDLSALTKLYSNNNKISNIKELPKLISLNLSANNISDISFLKGLSTITQLDLSYNQICDISTIECLKDIVKIDLRNNKISELPKNLKSLNLEIIWKNQGHRGRGINLYGNPIKILPIEIVKQGGSAVEAYFKSLDDSEKKVLGEVKVLLVGDGGAGKTSLVGRLFGEDFNPYQTKTDGIQNRHLGIKSDTQSIKARFWDFGGQEVMHATHQFFLSKRSLYILVLDGRKEEDAEYWLKHIESFGGDSPILIVLNKIDQNPSFDVNRQFLKDKYKGIRGFYPISCATGKDFDKFSNALKNELKNVEFIQTIWPKSWFNVKSHLENSKKNYMSFQDYRKICSKENIGDMSDQDTLVSFLNDLGIVVHFTLQRKIMLKIYK